jgi:hypothetical protein
MATAERAAAAAALGEARAKTGAPAVEFRLRDVWDALSAADRREALRLFWKAIHVGPDRAVRLVARGPGREAEVAAI